MALKDAYLYSEISPGGLKGYARYPHEGAESKFITLTEINNGDELTISSEDAFYVIKWLVKNLPPEQQHQLRNQAGVYAIKAGMGQTLTVEQDVILAIGVQLRDEETAAELAERSAYAK